MNSTLYILIACVLAGAAIGCTSSEQTQGKPMNAQATILLYSGRLDPKFELDEAALNQLSIHFKAANANAEFKGSTVIPSILGYKGILIENPSGVAGLPSRLYIFKGNLETAGEQHRFYTDEGATAETFLLNLALRKQAIGEKEMQVIKSR